MPKESNKVNININGNGEYDLDVLVVLSSDTCLITCAGEEIASYKNGRLIMKQHVTQQVNLYGDITQMDLFIKAYGPVYIDGNIVGQLNISAPSLCCAKTIDCQKLALSITNTVVFYDNFQAKQVDIQTKNLIIQSKFMVQGEQQRRSRIEVTKLFNVTHQAEISLFHSDLRAKYLTINGNALIQECSLTVNRLDDNCATKSIYKNCAIIAEDEIVVNRHSDINTLSLIAKNIYIRSSGKILDVVMEADSLYLEPKELQIQGGSQKTKNIFLTNNENCTAVATSLHIETNTISLLKGNFKFVDSVIISNCHGQGNQFISGELILDNSQIVDASQLQLDGLQALFKKNNLSSSASTSAQNDAYKQVQPTTVYVTAEGKITVLNNGMMISDQALLYGELRLDKAALTANLLLKARSNMRLSAAKVSVSDQLFLDAGKTDISDLSTIQARALSVNDTIAVNKSILESQSSLFIAKQGNLALNTDAGVYAKEMAVLGEVNNNRSLLASTNLHLYGILNTANEAATEITDRILAESQSRLDNQKSYLKSGALEVHGTLVGKQDEVVIDTEFAIRQYGNVHLDSSKVTAKTLHHAGAMTIDRDSISPDDAPTHIRSCHYFSKPSHSILRVDVRKIT